jgi:hypothetical protein
MFPLLGVPRCFRQGCPKFGPFAPAVPNLKPRSGQGREHPVLVSPVFKQHPRALKHTREPNLRRLLTLLRQEKRPPLGGSVIRAPPAPREQIVVIQRLPVFTAPRAVLMAPPITSRGQMVQEPGVSQRVGHSPLPIVGCLAFTLSLSQL